MKNFKENNESMDSGIKVTDPEYPSWGRQPQKGVRQPNFCGHFFSQKLHEIFKNLNNWGARNANAYFRTDHSGGSRISPRWGRQHLRGANMQFLPKFSKNSMKLKKNWTPRGGGCASPAPGPPRSQIRHWTNQCLQCNSMNTSRS